MILKEKKERERIDEKLLWELTWYIVMEIMLSGKRLLKGGRMEIVKKKLFFFG